MAALPTMSALERADACPPSAALPQVHSTSIYAEAGNARHRYLELVRGGKPQEEALAQIPEEHRAMCAAIDVASLPQGVAAEVAFAYDIATGKAREIGRGIGRQYGPLAPTEIAGTSDMVGLNDEAVYIGDAKGPWAPLVPAARNWQVRTGALAAARAYGRNRAVVELIRIRDDGSTWRDTAELDALDLDVHAYDLEALVARVRAAQGVVAAGRVPDVAEGDHCRWCPAWSSCPAKAALIKRLATGAEAEELELLKPMTPATAGLALVRIKEARRLLDRIETAVFATREEYGYLELPGGKHQRKVIVEGNRQLDGRLVYQVAREMHGQDFAEAAVTIKASQEGIKRAIVALAAEGKVPPRGQSKALKAILDEVEGRGGLTRPPAERWVEVDPEPEDMPAAAGEEAA